MVGLLNSKLGNHHYYFCFEKLHGKDLEYASGSKFRPGMWRKGMIEL